MSDEGDKFSTQNCQSHMTIVVFGTYCHIIVFLVTTNDNKFRGKKQGLCINPCSQQLLALLMLSIIESLNL